MHELLQRSIAMTILLWSTSLNVRMCAVPTSVNNDPLTSVKNPANNTLNETKVNSLEPTKNCVLPKSLPALCRIALLDDTGGKGAWNQ